MKDWWLNLALREKQTLAMGSIIVVLFLLYEIIWAPLIHINDSLRIRIQHNRETLSWMQNADQRLQQLAKEKNNPATGSLLGITQAAIKKSALASHITQLRQAENDSVQFNLRKADFDEFIIFLTTLWKKYDFIVSQISVIPTGEPGEVSADVVIRK